MRTKLYFVTCIVVLVLSCATASVSRAQCLLITTTSKGYTWPPSSFVQVVNAGVPSGDLGTAMSNWNVNLESAAVCYPPLFTTSVGTSQTIFMSSVATIPVRANPPGGSDTATVGVPVVRGLTDLSTPGVTFLGGRLFTVNIYILSAMTADAAITEVVAHELGHTLGLSDCEYPGCGIFSSVMEANAPTQPLPSTINGTVGQPGPTSCDVLSVLSVAPDYLCPPPPPPPPQCCPYSFFNGVCYPCTSPIILDLSGQGFSLTSAEGGVLFDISGSGHPIQMGWTASSADNAFLALPGADGLVHDGKQLFGNFTPQPASDHPNGFAALAVYDLPANGGNGDGVIDSRDAIFSSLRLWIDTNHDGICQPEELHTLPSLGVNSISLKYKLSEKEDQYGNRFRYRAKVNPDDPDASRVDRNAYDVFFVVLNPSGSTKNLLNPEGQKCAVPTSTKGGMLSTTGTLR
jgi:hypothetical protein